MNAKGTPVPAVEWPGLPGAESDVWDRSPLPPNVVVGEGCRVERIVDTFRRFRSRRDPGLRLGAGVHVYRWTSFNIEPEGAITVGDDSILVGAILMCAEEITIGRSVVLSHNVVVADCDFHPLDPALRRADAIANAPEGDRSQRPHLDTAPVVIGDGARVGIGAIVLKGVRIGAGARVGPGCVVTRDVPAGATAVGNPAAIVD
jgi:acetyltransferase-like isoleucine patch superfamily enzyme